MRKFLKRALLKIGLYYPLIHLRQFPTICRWVMCGCPSPPPHLIKLHVVRSYSKQFRLSKFIETGTYLGETAEWMSRAGFDVITIELSSELHRWAKERLRRYANLELILGDSAQLLPELLSRLNEPACFWLDAHYSGGKTAKGK